MEATIKKSNLILPTSGYELNQEEMIYVEGGSRTTFRGAAANARIVEKLVAAGASAAGLIGSILSITKGVGLAVGSGGILAVPGAILAVAGAIGASWSLVMLILGSASVISAIFHNSRDGGFTEQRFGIFGFSWSVITGL